MKRSLKLFLRLALAAGFLSAVADRFGLWPAEIAVWGSYDAFLEYTQVLLPWAPPAIIPALGAIATAAEILFGVFLLFGFRTRLFAKLSGVLLLLFAVAMTLSTGFKGAFDFSVFTASAAAFALGMMKEKFLEIDSWVFRDRPKRRR